tara:strand:+ start:1889 stop:2392 length:504 start_codon:yes stop_codon:yes gene_type:complete
MVATIKVGKIAAATGTTVNVESGHVIHQPGSVLQVVSAQTTGSSTNVTSTSFVEVSNQLRATITPKFATSKLLVMFQSSMYRSTSASNPWGVQTIFRDGVNIAGGNYQFGYTQVTGGNGSDIHSGIKMVDANNTNSTTFSLYVRAGSNHTMQLESADRNITVMEIAQ